jgi:nicotinamidase-related amidase
MMKTALLVVDVQQGLIDGHPYRGAELLEEIGELIKRARASGTEVVFVRHNEDDESGLFPGSPAWQVHPTIAPAAGEKIFDKRFSSAFKDTGLDEYLKGRGIGALVVAGMQTEFCIDATIKSAFERGYKVYVPEGGSTTYDNALAPASKLVHFYERIMWNGRFADVVPLSEALNKLS